MVCTQSMGEGSVKSRMRTRTYGSVSGRGLTRPLRLDAAELPNLRAFLDEEFSYGKFSSGK
jgi:hypothetical protein